MIHLEEIKSTNSWVLEQLSNGNELPEGEIVWTSRQTAGRGQVGNSWEAEPDKNLSMSVLLRPEWLAPRDQFVISQITAMAVCSVVKKCLPEHNVSIKWPNDIYVGDEKIAGILIENKLQGVKFAVSVLGIGLNINQERWISDAPNPTSLKLKAGKEFEVEVVLNEIGEEIFALYQELCQACNEGIRLLVHSRFEKLLYRREGEHLYVDVRTNEPFMAKINRVEPSGQLCLALSSGEERKYWFKEVKFVLPCGVTKE